MADQSGGDRRLVQNGTIHRRQLPRAQPPCSAQTRLPPDVSHRLEVRRRTRRRIPVVALHRAVFLPDHRAIDAMAGARISAAEAIGIGVHELCFMERHGRAFGVDQTPVDTQRRGFAFAAERDCLIDGEFPRVIQVEIAPGSREQRGIGQSRAVVLRGIARDGERLGHRILDRSRGKVGRACVPRRAPT